MNFKRRLSRLLFASSPVLLISPIAGCAGKAAATATPARMTQQEGTDAARDIEKSPLKFMEETLQRTGKLEQYELTFFRQERNGTLVKRMGPVEEIRAKFRKTPFSVKFYWPQPDADYDESLYVEGQHDNKLIVRERKGILGFPPQTRVLNLMDPVTLGRSKNPITSFGLYQVTRQSLLSFQDPSLNSPSELRYQGIVNLDPMNEPSYHLHMTRKSAPNIRYTVQDFYISTRTGLPSGTDLYLPDGTFDAKYRYTDVKTDAHFTDDDFRMKR